MRIFAISDIHIDYTVNERWVFNLSMFDYKEDILILAGDVTYLIPSLIKAFEALKVRFKEVIFIPGNHDLWVCHERFISSLMKFDLIKKIARDCGICTEPFHTRNLSIVPMLSWYDYSFGRPAEELSNIWTDYWACKMPEGFDETKLTRHFISMNKTSINRKNNYIISFSHFLPRLDLMPDFIPFQKRILYPVLGTSLLEDLIRKIGSNIHIYGHSHVNQLIRKDGVLYINNAFGYPHESLITSKKLLCVYTV